jgi:hypothetical protein
MQSKTANQQIIMLLYSDSADWGNVHHQLESSVLFS